MRVVPYADPRTFRSAAEGWLREDEARHNLILGILGTLIDQPDVYERFHLWLVEDGGRPVGAALMTPPHNIIVATPAAPGACACLADGLAAEGIQVPGVVAALPEADEFARCYLDAVGGRVGARMDQAIHVLDTVASVPEPPGEARQPGPEDVELVLDWYRAFHEEAAPQEPWDEERAGIRFRRRLAKEGEPLIRLWEDEEPACLVGFAHETAGGTRVGPVYTPPEHRCRGYATALTAHVSRERLAAGSRFCLLYTDLANPTSNAIYHRIGYRVVCESAMLEFAR